MAQHPGSQPLTPMDAFRAAVKRLPKDRTWTKVMMNSNTLQELTRRWPAGLSTDQLLGFQVETDRMIAPGELQFYAYDPPAFQPMRLTP